MKCRNCKKEYVSNEWKETGTFNGFCSNKCREESHKYLKPCKIIDTKKLIKKMNEVE